MRKLLINRRGGGRARDARSRLKMLRSISPKRLQIAQKMVTYKKMRKSVRNLMKLVCR